MKEIEMKMSKILIYLIIVGVILTLPMIVGVILTLPMNAQGFEEKAQSENMLSGALKSLLAVIHVGAQNDHQKEVITIMYKDLSDDEKKKFDEDMKKFREEITQHHKDDKQRFINHMQTNEAIKESQPVQYKERKEWLEEWDKFSDRMEDFNLRMGKTFSK